MYLATNSYSPQEKQDVIWHSQIGLLRHHVRCLEEQSASTFKVKMTTGTHTNFFWNRFNTSEAIFKIMCPHLTGIKFCFHKTEGQIYVKRQTHSRPCITCSSGTNQPLTTAVHSTIIKCLNSCKFWGFYRGVFEDVMLLQGTWFLKFVSRKARKYMQWCGTISLKTWTLNSCQSGHKFFTKSSSYDVPKFPKAVDTYYTLPSHGMWCCEFIV